METGEGQKKENNLSAANSEFRPSRFDFYAATKSRYYNPVAVGILCANWEIGCESLGIKGHFEIVPEEDRGLSGDSINSELPIYDVSWIVEELI